MPNLNDIPTFALEEIAFHVALSPFLGPPRHLPNFLCVSRRIYYILCIENTPHLYARIFQAKFDIAPVVRRWGSDMALVAEQASELVSRCKALKRLRHGVYPRYVECEQLRVDLWTAYLMFLENDGNNARQLVRYARIDAFALDFVRLGGRLHDGAADNQGWTLQNEINALALWLFWFTDFERIPHESQAERDVIVDALSPIYAGSFKYPSTHAPLTYFFIPPLDPPAPTPPLSILPFSTFEIPPPCIIPSYFDCEVTLACPLLVPPVLLSFICRQEVQYHARPRRDNGVPIGSTAPATRAEARRTGWTGATGEDHLAFDALHTMREEWMRDGRSIAYDHDWYRLRTCYDPWGAPVRDRVYKPGMLDGLWDGKWLMILPPEFQALLAGAQAGIPLAQNFMPAHYQTPMQFRIREHHQRNPRAVLNFDDNGPGALRAWIPPGIRFVERERILQVFDDNDRTVVTSYDTYSPDHQGLDEDMDVDMEHVGPYGDGVYDILLTAETDFAFGEAWGHHRYRGRVRDWDGLIVLERMPVDGQGRWIFQGYLHGNQNLVGRWRETATQIDAPGWEGAWSMAKCEEAA